MNPGRGGGASSTRGAGGAMLMSMPTAANAGATEPTSIVAAKVDKTIRPRFEATFRLIPRRSLRVFTLNNLRSHKGSARCPVNAYAKAGFRRAHGAIQGTSPHERFHNRKKRLRADAVDG
jgi:hypothetical protein